MFWVARLRNIRRYPSRFLTRETCATPYFTDLTGIYSVETNRPVFATGQNSYSDQSNAQAEVVAGGVGEVLLDAEVAFGSLNGSMTQRNLDLFERGVAFVGEF